MLRATASALRVPPRAVPLLVDLFVRDAETYKESAKAKANGLAADRSYDLRFAGIAKGIALEIRDTGTVDLSHDEDVRDFFETAITGGNGAMDSAIQDGRWSDLRALAKTMDRISRQNGDV